MDRFHFPHPLPTPLHSLLRTQFFYVRLIEGVEYEWRVWSRNSEWSLTRNHVTARAANMYSIQTNTYGTAAAGMYGWEAGGQGYVAIYNAICKYFE